jgi:adenylyltransferase/sulfurtransferase
MNDRYSRKICLPEIGLEGQKKISNASILCVGAGGLGSPALLYLAAAGVGRIGIADFDRVDASNLQRQIIFTEKDITYQKTECAARHVHEKNSEITIETHPEGLNAENAEKLFERYDLVLDGTDNFEAKYLINDAAVKFGKPMMYGAIQRFDGQASVFDARKGPCYRCLFPHPPKAQIMNCAEAGVIGAVAGLVGITQAMQAIQVIIGHADFEPLIGKLWTIDAILEAISGNDNRIYRKFLTLIGSYAALGLGTVAITIYFVLFLLD